MRRVRREIALRGVVQGVGLRPWSARRARELDLAGSIRNDTDGVRIALEGREADVERWLEALRAGPPTGARVESVELTDGEPCGATGFEIASSRLARSSRGRIGRIPPDVPVCEPCVAELFDRKGRRYRYPFTHCATCGPRASVLQALPYDRARTTLSAFDPCKDCHREYGDENDRRYHAQTLACPACGPRLHALEENDRTAHSDPVERAAAGLAAGEIVGVKGYGGYHLLADATCERAVARLRERKGRPSRPLAVMVADVEAARALASLGPEDEALLSGPARAVVVARRKAGREAPLALGIAPGLGDLGLALPCAPVHWLLLFGPNRRPGADAARFDALVFTSANRSGEPTLHDDADAREELAGVADLLLVHDRAIARPSDDPVYRTSTRGPIPIRLSRSTAPRVIRLPDGLRAEPPLLAVGGDLKCAPALAVGDEVMIAEHVGDLASVAAADALAARLTGLCDLDGVEAGRAACDAHPDAIGAAVAREVGLDPIPVQHHHAHAASCLVENGCLGPALAWVLDGAGWGSDQTVWGGELLLVERGFGRCRRLHHLEQVPLPGGDAAAREPWRMAAVWLDRAFPEGAPRLPWHARRDPSRLATLLDLAARGVASPRTSSCGRLFDAVASLVGGPDVVSFEGEAAMVLESLADPDGALADRGTEAVAQEGARDAVPLSDLVRDVALASAAGERREAIAARFHSALAERLAQTARIAADATGVTTVALSGGCLQNRILLEALAQRLEALGLTPLWHRRVPPNDGGLALGQIAVILGSDRRGAAD